MNTFHIFYNTPVYLVDDNILLYISGKKQLISWDVQQQKILAKHNIAHIPGIRDEIPKGASFPGIGNLSGSVMTQSQLAFFDKKKKSIVVFTVGQDTVRYIPFSHTPNNIVITKNLLAVYYENNVIIYDLTTQKIRQQWETAKPISHLIFSPDNRKVIVATDDHKIHVYDIQQPQNASQVKGSFAKAHRIAFLGPHLVMVADKIYVWDIEKNHLLYTIDKKANANVVLGKKYLAMRNSDSLLELWDIRLDKKRSFPFIPRVEEVLSNGDFLVNSTHKSVEKISFSFYTIKICVFKKQKLPE